MTNSEKHLEIYGDGLRHSEIGLVLVYEVKKNYSVLETRTVYLHCISASWERFEYALLLYPLFRGKANKQVTFLSSFRSG